jgi:hypothetical protein
VGRSPGGCHGSHRHDTCMNEQTKTAALKNARVQTAVHRSKGQEKVLTQLALPCSSAQMNHAGQLLSRLVVMCVE